MNKKLKEELRERGRNIALIETMANELVGKLYNSFREMMAEMEKGYLEQKALITKATKIAGHGDKPDTPRPKPAPRPQKKCC